MKASNIGLWLAGAALAWIAWILLDMSSPAVSSPGSSASMAMVKSSSVPVLVEFYADWCGPCRTVAPVVEELSLEVAGRAKVIRLNVDTEATLASQHGVRGIPTFIAFKNGHEVSRQSGAIPKAMMLKMLGL